MQKKALLALAVFGLVSMGTSQAMVFKSNNDEFANVGLELQIWAQDNGKETVDGHSSTNFSVNNARVYFSGQVNPMVQFGADLDFADNNALGATGTAKTHQGTAYTRVSSAFINFKFMPEVQLMAGLMRDPVSRLSNTDRYTYVIPTGYGYAFNDGTDIGTWTDPFTPIALGNDIQNENKDAGITLWGNVADTMLKYYLFAGNGAYDYQAGLNGKSNLKYGFRVEFTPTMLGYKNTSGYSNQDTYLGAMNNLTIGLGYETQKVDCSGVSNTSDLYQFCTGITSFTPKELDLDANWEQKFGSYVPQVQMGYIDKSDLGNIGYGTVKSRGYYLQLAGLYDQVVGIGKPGLAFRWENARIKNFGPGTEKIDRYGIFANYYISGEAARVSFGADVINYNNYLQTYGYKDHTDWTLALQTEF